MSIRRFDPSSRYVEDKADILLVTATDVETAALRRVFTDQFGPALSHRFIGNHTYYDLGLIGGARVFLVQSEMGTSTAGGALLTVQAGIQALQPCGIVMVGIAFGVDPISQEEEEDEDNRKKQKIGEILISKELFLYELQRVSSGPRRELVIVHRGGRVTASTKLLDRFRSSSQTWSVPPNSKVHFGLMLSGEKLVDNQNYRDQLLQIAEAIGGEMEGAGLYVAAQDARVDWIVIKAICDFADGNKNRNKDKYQELAATNAARFVIHALKQGGFKCENPRQGSGRCGVTIIILFFTMIIGLATLIVNPQISGLVLSPTSISTTTMSPPLTNIPKATTPPLITPIASCRATRSGSSDVFPIYPNYDPSGLMGDIGDINVQKNANGVRFRYETQGRGPHEFEYKYVDGQLNTKPAQFAGVMYLSPPNNFGNQPGLDLQATHRVIKWEARSVSGSANVEFVIGGITWRWDHQQKKIVGVACPDSLSRTPLGIKTLDAEWQTFEADLSNIPQEQFSNVIGGFSWIISWGSNGVELDPSTGLPKAPKTFEIEIRDIRYER